MLIFIVSTWKKRKGITGIHNHWKRIKNYTYNCLRQSHNLKVASPYSPYGFSLFTFVVFEGMTTYSKGELKDRDYCLRQTSIAQCCFAILPLRVSLNDFDSFGEVGGVIPYREHRNTQTRIVQHTLLFDALEWRSTVEFRAAAPGHAPNVRLIQQGRMAKNGMSRLKNG